MHDISSANSPASGFKAPTDQKLGYCLYQSIAQPDLDRYTIDEIVETSRHNNRLRGLTGCLHYENGTFFQWLEGPWREVFRLLDVLRDDDRHLDMKVLDQGSLQQRLFNIWDMRFSDREVASLFDWLADWNNRTDDGNDQPERVRAFLRSIRADT